MGSMRNRVLAVVGMAGVLLAGAPALARAGSATLYELTEDMKIAQGRAKRGAVVNRRQATSALSGVAEVGTPLCPYASLASGPGGCVVNVDGMDDISLATGLGTLNGQFATVIAGDNPVDGPELVALQGVFTGKMDFSPAILSQIPYGTVTGKVSTGKGSTGRTFSGVFRLPFAGNVSIDVGGGYKMTVRQIFCPLSPNPNPLTDAVYGGWDLAYLDFDANGLPNGACLDIQPNETALGRPLVRFDIRF